MFKKVASDFWCLCVVPLVSKLFFYDLLKIPRELKTVLDVWSSHLYERIQGNMFQSNARFWIVYVEKHIVS